MALANGTYYVRYIQNLDTPFYSESDTEKTRDLFTIKHDAKGWEESLDDNWHYFMYHPDLLPDQGWKIHISANINDASELLNEVSHYLMDQYVSFKFVPGLEELKISYSKNADRIESGKFITIYPKNDNEFFSLLDPLKKITDKYLEGPYILNDCPWKQSNVYFRYGGFIDIQDVVAGEVIHSLKGPNGELIEDKRVPYYSIPEFVEEPSYITDNNNYPFPEEFNDLDTLGIQEPVHFSNSGGVYKGIIKGKDYIVKEGRPFIGLDQNDKDGFTRVNKEYRVLRQLNSIKNVVNVFEYKEVWEHNYLVEEFVHGDTLGKFMALEYPFPNNFPTEDYKNKVESIINGLIDVISQIHEMGIAMVDFQPENIIVNFTGTEATIKLIDFESAEKLHDPYNPDLVTQDYASYQSKTFEEGDWYALYRLARDMFLPTESVMVYTEELEKIQNKNIAMKFGADSVDFLNHVKELCRQHTPIYRQADYYMQEVNCPDIKVSRKSISKILNEIANGITQNVDMHAKNLIFGDIQQYAFDNDLSKYAIENGAFGGILALNRYNSELLKNNIDFSNWLDEAINDIKSILKEDRFHDIGLFTGLTGIAMSLYELNYVEEAENIMNYVNNHSHNLDISIESGMAGIGFANLSLFYKTKKLKFKENAYRLGRDIIKHYENTTFKSDNLIEGEFSLIKGWAGAVLFLWKLGITLNNQDMKQVSLEILDDLLENGLVKANQGISLLDNSRGMPRLLPYLNTGFSGLSLVLLEIQKDDSNAVTQSMQEPLDYIAKDIGSFCTYQCCLFNGVTGLIVTSIAVKNIFGSTKSMDIYLNSLNNYALSNKNGNIIFPGPFGVKCSMDYATGASGILLTLLDLQRDNRWDSWFPVVEDSGLNIFTSKPTKEVSI